MKKTLSALLLTALFAFSLSSCDSTDDAVEPTKDTYNIVAFSINASDYTGFMTAYKAVPSGEVTNSASSNTKQLKQPSASQTYKNFLFCGYNYIGEPGIQKNVVDETGKISQVGFLSTGGFPKYVIINDTIGYYCDAKRDKLTLQMFNPTTMLRTGQIDLSSLSRGFVWETVGLRVLVARDGKLFADLNYSAATAGYGNDAVDSAEMVVIDIATNTMEKVIVQPGVRGMGYVNALPYCAMTTNKDLYIMSIGNLFGERNSHLIRIPAGSTDFDSWVLKMDDISIDKFLLNLYAWGNRLFVLTSDEIVDASFTNFGADIYTWKEVNTAAKTLTVVPGVAVHNFQGQQNPIVIGDKMYIPANNTSKKSYYVYDGTNVATEAFHFTDGFAGGLYKLEN
jgi:hypothetical protein